MTTATTNATRKQQRKLRPKPARAIRVLEQPGPDTNGWGAVAITVGKQTDTYLLHTIPTDFGNGAMGFEVEKLDADLATVETYHVLLADRLEACSCDCRGHERWGHCKHREGIQALAKAGKIPAHRSAGQFAANDPDGYAASSAAIDSVFTANPKDRAKWEHVEADFT